MFYEKSKKFIPIILLATIILTVYFQCSTSKSQAQGGYGYPVILEGVNPDAISWVRFWVSTTNMNGTASTTLSVKDDSTINIRTVKEVAGGTAKMEQKTVNSLELLAAMYQETIRHNLWYEGVSVGDQIQDEKLTQIGARNLIDGINATTTKWINDGFNFSTTSNTGNPAYVSDSGSILAKKDDLLIKDMLTNNPAMNSLDKSIDLQVKRAIQSENSKDSSLSESLKCTAKKVDPDAPIDWDNWISLALQPQCTELGAKDIIEQDILSRQASQAEEFNSELSYGNGSLSYKNCIVYEIADGKKTKLREYKGDPVYDQKAEDTYVVKSGPLQTFTVTECTIATPGSVVSEQLNSLSTYQNKIAETTAALGDSTKSVLNNMKTEIANINEKRLKEGFLRTSGTDSYENKLEALKDKALEKPIGESPSDTRAKDNFYNPGNIMWNSLIGNTWNNNDAFNPCKNINFMNQDFCTWFNTENDLKDFLDI
ncbi:MAG: hypothetical protein NTU76_00830 [Candidatus Taylorbacteria bacterium]|nr:hypothetical protein [Candidatus Taylorbacteria bacterium]